METYPVYEENLEIILNTLKVGFDRATDNEAQYNKEETARLVAAHAIVVHFKNFKNQSFSKLIDSCVKLAADKKGIPCESLEDLFEQFKQMKRRIATLEEERDKLHAIVSLGELVRCLSTILNDYVQTLPPNDCKQGRGFEPLWKADNGNRTKIIQLINSSGIFQITLLNAAGNRSNREPHSSDPYSNFRHTATYLEEIAKERNASVHIDIRSLKKEDIGWLIATSGVQNGDHVRRAAQLFFYMREKHPSANMVLEQRYNLAIFKCKPFERKPMGFADGALN